MDPVIAVRAQAPLPVSLTHLAPDHVTSMPAAQSTRPVTEAIRKDAVQQPSGMAAQVAIELAERDEDQHPVTAVRAAADAARDAYIRASIAAGLNPLPLP